MCRQKIKIFVNVIAKKMESRFWEKVSRQLENVCVLYFFLTIIGLSIEGSLQAAEKKNSSIPSYKCYKVSEGTVHIDGKLDEDCWQNAPIIEFRDLLDGSRHEITGSAKMLWDDKYIYVAYEIHDPNVVAYYGERKRGRTLPNTQEEPHTGEPEIMFRDTFVKFFLDPDADGMNYIEIHINPINNIADLLIDYPYIKKGREEIGITTQLPTKADWSWNCEGLKSAVQIQGTLNFSDDIDQGWTVELAIPWESLKPITKGPYSPNMGENKWCAHLGHVYKPEFDYSNRRKSKHVYSTWPVLGEMDCHLPARWGYLVFTKEMLTDKRGKNL